MLDDFDRYFNCGYCERADQWPCKVWGVCPMADMYAIEEIRKVIKAANDDEGDYYQTEKVCAFEEIEQIIEAMDEKLAEKSRYDSIEGAESRSEGGDDK